MTSDQADRLGSLFQNGCGDKHKGCACKLCDPYDRIDEVEEDLSDLCEMGRRAELVEEAAL